MKISKNKVMIAVIVLLCAVVAVLVTVLVIRKDKNKDNDDKFTPTIDSDAGEIGTESNYSGGQQGIRIPGYPSITVDAGKAEDGIRDLIVTGVQTCALPI